jgi:sec-independent protein translocase protein TatA
MGNIGFSELMIILVVALLLFGARRLPEIGASLGKGIREFKRSISDVSDAVNSMPSDDRSKSGREIDGGTPSASSPTQGGEPKRLSQ